MRKVTIEVKVKMTIAIDDDAEVGEIIDEMEYDFTDTTGKADIHDTQIEDWEIQNSR